MENNLTPGSLPHRAIDGPDELHNANIAEHGARLFPLCHGRAWPHAYQDTRRLEKDLAAHAVAPPSWPGLSGPSPPAPAAIDGPDVPYGTPTMDKPRSFGLSARWIA